MKMRMSDLRSLAVATGDLLREENAMPSQGNDG